MSNGGSPLTERTAIRVVLPEVQKMVNEKLVPLVKIGNREFFVDIDKREFVDANDTNRCINMHSKQGRRMVDEMIATEWHCFAVYPVQQNEV